MIDLYFFNRLATNDCPAGITVSKRPQFLSGDFSITEYKFPRCTLWFVDADKFTANEREAAAAWSRTK